MGRPFGRHTDMSTEFGVFSDEGKIDGGFYSFEEAQNALESLYAEEDDVHVGECCHDHPEHEKDTCELCNAEEDEESSEGE